MSAPQPPNQPWQGGQPNQEQQQGQQPYGQQQPPEQNPAITAPGPTSVIGGPGQGGPGGPPPGDGVERTQVVRPEHQQQGQGDATQMVPPGSMPPPPPQYAPPPGAEHSPPGGFPGQQPPYGQQPGYGQQPPPPPGYGPPPGQGFGQQPPPGYGPPPGGFAHQQGLGSGPTFGGQGQNTQLIAWGIAGLVAILGLVVAIIALVDLGDLGDYSDGYDSAGDAATKDFPAPGMLYLCNILLIVGGLAAIGGGVLIFLKHKLASMVTLAAGGVLVVFSIIYMILFAGLPEGVSAGDLKVGDAKIWGLIFGLLIAGAGALGFFPQTKQFLGGGSALGGPGAGPGFGGPPSGGFGQQPAPYGQPPQQGFGHQPPPPGYGQPPQQPGGYGQHGGPPQQW